MNPDQTISESVDFPLVSFEDDASQLPAPPSDEVIVFGRDPHASQPDEKRKTELPTDPSAGS